MLRDLNSEPFLTKREMAHISRHESYNLFAIVERDPEFDSNKK